ncbi:hypothetical protein BV20DRAFT_859840 [Pilatotrama ljubarskyi]|nr:hypothetical protein BV20DRAFT_859840 [Pilatotrama ljubarskyi]
MVRIIGGKNDGSMESRRGLSVVRAVKTGREAGAASPARSWTSSRLTLERRRRYLSVYTSVSSSWVSYARDLLFCTVPLCFTFTTQTRPAATTST